MDLELLSDETTAELDALRDAATSGSPTAAHALDEVTEDLLQLLAVYQDAIGLYGHADPETAAFARDVARITSCRLMDETAARHRAFPVAPWFQ